LHYDHPDFRRQTIRLDLGWNFLGASQRSHVLFVSLQVALQPPSFRLPLPPPPPTQFNRFSHAMLRCAESISRGQSWWWQPTPSQTLMDAHLSTAASRPAALGSSGRSGVALLQWEEDYVSCIQALFDSGCACFA
jgi:hypothetical protein